jgi:hypothetical protein
MMATASPNSAGVIDFECRSAIAAIHADFSPPEPGNELKMPQIVPIIPNKRSGRGHSAKAPEATGHLAMRLRRRTLVLVLCIPDAFGSIALMKM